MSITDQELTIQIGTADLTVTRSGPLDAPTLVFLHGWPQNARAWDGVVSEASKTHQCLTLDLPGVGRSTTSEPMGRKSDLADLLHSALTELGVVRPYLVGHDIGGMVAFSYLRKYPLAGAVIMDTVIPGLEPWHSVQTNPHVWHFSFHSIPELPEVVVGPHLRRYLDYFFDALAACPSSITDSARQNYTDSYSTPDALRQGFEFYRTFPLDVTDNTAVLDAIDTPVIYLRGVDEPGDLDQYARGLWSAGLNCVQVGTIAKAGHFSPEENPAEVWRVIHKFIAGHTSSSSQAT